jgi:hypothetical protein
MIDADMYPFTVLLTRPIKKACKVIRDDVLHHIEETFLFLETSQAGNFLVEESEMFTVYDHNHIGYSKNVGT